MSIPRSVRLGALLLGAATVARAAQDPAPPPPVTTDVAPEDPAAVRARLVTLFEGALSDTSNGQDFVETPGYRKLLEILEGYAPEMVSERAAAPLDYERALSDPDVLRGGFVRVRGILAGVSPTRLDVPIAGYEDVYRGVITDADGGGGVVFDMLRQPPEAEQRRDVVDIEGIFYRTVRYQPQKGPPQEAPYLLVKSLRVVDEESVHSQAVPGEIQLLILGLAVAYILGRVFWVLNKRKGRGDRTAAERSVSLRAAAHRVAARRIAGGGAPPDSTLPSQEQQTKPS